VIIRQVVAVYPTKHIRSGNYSTLNLMSGYYNEDHYSVATKPPEIDCHVIYKVDILAKVPGGGVGRYPLLAGDRRRPK